MPAMPKNPSQVNPMTGCIRGTTQKPKGAPKLSWLGAPRLGDPGWPAYVKKWQEKSLAQFLRLHKKRK